MRNNFLIIGLVLMAYPFFLLLQKLYFETRYDLRQLDNNNFSVADKKIEISDDFPVVLNPTDSSIEDQRGPVRIKIDEVEFSSHTELVICTDLEGKDRYQGWLAIFELVDNFARRTSIVIVQRLDEMNDDASNFLKIRFRFIYIPVREKTWTETLSADDLNSNCCIEVSNASILQSMDGKCRSTSSVFFSCRATRKNLAKALARYRTLYNSFCSNRWFDFYIHRVFEINGIKKEWYNFHWWFKF